LVRVYRNGINPANMIYNAQATLVSGTGNIGDTNTWGLPLQASWTFMERAGDQLLYSISNAGGSNGRTFTINPVSRTYRPASAYRWQILPSGPLVTSLTVGQLVALRANLGFEPPLTYPNSYLTQATAVSIVSGSVPPGLSASFDPSTQAILSGTPTTPGTYTFTLRVTGSPSQTTTAFNDVTFTVTVNP
jgi:hypothetical protein